jgi:hypothetical protein
VDAACASTGAPRGPGRYGYTDQPADRDRPPPRGVPVEVIPVVTDLLIETTAAR